MGNVDRRSFLKGVAAATTATVLPDALLAAAPSGSGEPSPATRPAPVWHRTPCRLCGLGCGLLVAVQDGRAVAVKGDPDSPVNRGLACVKGYHAIQALYGRDRITRALVRRGGRQTPAALGEAYDLVAQKLRETVATHGKDSVALYGGQWTVADAYVGAKLFKGALGTNNIDSSARLYDASARAGLLDAFGLDGAVGCYDDVEHADVFVLWDHNMAEADPVLFSRILQRRRLNPAVRIVDLATRTTRTSYAVDRSILYAPETEVAIANAICNELVARDWADREFVDHYVAFRRGRTDIGYDIANGAKASDDGAAASYDDFVRFLEAYDPDRVARIAGVGAEDIRWLASLYGDRSRRVMSIWGTTLNQRSRGTWANDALHDVHLLAGKIGTPGNAALCMAGHPGASAGALDAGAMPDGLPRGTVHSADDRRLAARIWGVSAERIDTRPGRTALSLFRGVERGEIRFLWIQATNPMVSLPNLTRYRQAIEKHGTFVVVSEAYPTPTTDVADVVLPAAMWLEREGVFASGERRAGHFDQVVLPPGDSTADAWQMIEVARRLGFAPMFPSDERGHVAAIWAEYARFHDGDARHRLPPLAALRETPGSLWPFVNGRETQRRYATASDPAASRARGEYDFYGHPDHRAWIWLRPYEPPAESPDSTYPFRLATGRVLEHCGTGAMTQRIPVLHRAVPRSYVEINRADAQALGVANGETVRLVSRRGTLEIEARIDYRSQPARGQLFVPVFDEGHPINRLTIDAGCPIAGEPATSAVRVELVGRSRA